LSNNQPTQQFGILLVGHRIVTHEIVVLKVDVEDQHHKNLMIQFGSRWQSLADIVHDGPQHLPTHAKSLGKLRAQNRVGPGNCKDLTANLMLLAGGFRMGHRNARNDVIYREWANSAESFADHRILLLETLLIQSKQYFSEYAIPTTEVSVHGSNRAPGNPCNIRHTKPENSAVNDLLTSRREHTLPKLQFGERLRRVVHHASTVVCAPMRRPLLMVALVTLVVVAGCTSTSGDTSDNSTVIPDTTTVDVTTTDSPSAPGAEPAAIDLVPPGFESITTSDGRVRSYKVEDLSNGEPAPLLFVLHGFGGSAADVSSYTRFDETLFETYDLHPVVVYPNGTGIEGGLPQSWNAGGCCPFSTFDLVDDVAFLDQLITELATRYDIDPERVWVVGHSNGGMMAYRAACELSSRITAIGVAAGAMMIDPCSPTRPVAALHLHGGLDTVVPLAGGNIAGILFPSAKDSVDAFIRTGIGTAELVTDATWPHDWQSEWTALFAEFLAAQ